MPDLEIHTEKRMPLVINGWLGLIIRTVLPVIVTIVMGLTTLFLHRLDNVLDTVIVDQRALAEQVAENTKDLAVIDGNRFRASDGLLVWQEIYQLRADINTLKEGR